MSDDEKTTGADRLQQNNDSVDGLKSVYGTLDLEHAKGHKPDYLKEKKGFEPPRDLLAQGFAEDGVDLTGSSPADAFIKKGKKTTNAADEVTGLESIYSDEYPDITEEELEPNTDLSSDDEEIPVETEDNKEDAAREKARLDAAELAAASLHNEGVISIDSAKGLMNSKPALENWLLREGSSISETVLEQVADYISEYL